MKDAKLFQLVRSQTSAARLSLANIDYGSSPVDSFSFPEIYREMLPIKSKLANDDLLKNIIPVSFVSIEADLRLSDPLDDSAPTLFFGLVRTYFNSFSGQYKITTGELDSIDLNGNPLQLRTSAVYVHDGTTNTNFESLLVATAPDLVLRVSAWGTGDPDVAPGIVTSVTGYLITLKEPLSIQQSSPFMPLIKLTQAGAKGSWAAEMANSSSSQSLKSAASAIGAKIIRLVPTSITRLHWNTEFSRQQHLWDHWISIPYNKHGSIPDVVIPRNFFNFIMYINGSTPDVFDHMVTPEYNPSMLSTRQTSSLYMLARMLVNAYSKRLMRLGASNTSFSLFMTNSMTAPVGSTDVINSAVRLESDPNSNRDTFSLYQNPESQALTGITSIWLFPPNSASELGGGEVIMRSMQGAMIEMDLTDLIIPNPTLLTPVDTSVPTLKEKTGNNSQGYHRYAYGYSYPDAAAQVVQIPLGNI